MASEKLCETCRWWNTADEYVSDSPSHDDELFTCERIHAGGGKRVIKATIYPAGSSWFATRPNFGCVLHEPKLHADV